MNTLTIILAALLGLYLLGFIVMFLRLVPKTSISSKNLSITDAFCLAVVWPVTLVILKLELI